MTHTPHGFAPPGADGFVAPLRTKAIADPDDPHDAVGVLPSVNKTGSQIRLCLDDVYVKAYTELGRT